MSAKPGWKTNIELAAEALCRPSGSCACARGRDGCNALRRFESEARDVVSALRRNQRLNGGAFSDGVKR